MKQISKLMVVHHPSIWRFTKVLKDKQQSNKQVITQALEVILKYSHQLHDDTDKSNLYNQNC